MLRIPALRVFWLLDFTPELQGILNLGDVGKVSGVLDAETVHTVGVTPLREVTLERL